MKYHLMYKSSNNLMALKLIYNSISSIFNIFIKFRISFIMISCFLHTIHQIVGIIIYFVYQNRMVF